MKVNVTVNCSFGNREVSTDYGLFITYPLYSKGTFESIANDTKLDAELLKRYNFSQGRGSIFITDTNGSYFPFHSNTIGSGAIAGLSVGVLAGILLLSFCVYIKYYLKKKVWKKNLTLDDSKMMNSDQIGTEITDLMVEKSHEFSYIELSIATNKFSMSNKIGEGGFGEVFYAELRGQKAAIKKMKKKASKEFCAELKVLTRVHHLNLVGLIGYCVEGFLFLVYEYIDNGNLSQNLRDLEREPLTWSTRMQIALDSARCLEYIHEHTEHVYIHRDIKSENILLDQSFRAKVADFGLSKLADVDHSTSSNIIAEGTFGYMPPEYACGGVAPSSKIDVYAFGVVLYELISAKGAVIRDGPEVKGLVALFDEVLGHEPDPTDGLKPLVDPRLGDNYSIDSIYKMSQIAKACTMKDPQLRPTKEGDTYDLIANTYYTSLTTVEVLKYFNSYDPNHIPVKAKVNVTVNCSCGNSQISKDYGLFITYPLRASDTLEKIASHSKLDEGLVKSFNYGVNFSKGSGIVFIPGRDQNGDYVPLYPTRYFQKKKQAKTKLPETSMVSSSQDGNGAKFIVVDKSPEFSYKELANATDNFSLANKIGQGGFGEVYYGELRGKKTAIKKMKIQATREFLAELKVLTSVHHWNLVHLIGYCVEGSLFLVYEYIDNGNLNQHLHNSAKEPMTWSIRVQIALDVARGLEYIHDHSVPVYIHRDIKSDNILLNQNFTAKIADFGLTKLTDVASSTDKTDHVAGTFGYMPPENVYGRISRKIDVYAFGVVLYELISAKTAVIKIDKTEFEFKTNESIDEYKSLVALFDEVIDQEGDPIEEGLRKMVDPRLGDNYSIDSINKMTQLAKACINRDPKQRPTMRSVVVSLMTLNSTINDGTDSTSSSLAMEHDSN
ncbi:hypothetical protein P8452_44462 [Trifolium repens]|nr:hypothetical protein P8452_44462 [Trifolium repens]